MRKGIVLIFTVAAFFSTALFTAAADLQLFQNLSPGQPPVDVAVSKNGKWIYVLSAEGKIFIYTPAGQLKDEVDVGAGVDRIEAGLRDDLLYLSSQSDGTVKMVRVELVHDIPISGSPAKGPEDAPVTLVVFTDFQCPYCARAANLLDQVLAANPQSVRLVFKNFPLRGHAHARQAAAAALAAAAHGKFWAFHDRLFAEYNRITPEKIREIALSLGLPEKEFARQAAEPKIEAKIRQDIEEGREAGVTGTPTIFINGRLLQERTLSGFNEAVARELARSGS